VLNHVASVKCSDMAVSLFIHTGTLLILLHPYKGKGTVFRM